jgi:hypothetical protein
MSYKIYEDWYDLNSETNELKMLKEEKDCKMCKKYLDHIIFLEKTIEQLKTTQTVIYIKNKSDQDYRKTIL